MITLLWSCTVIYTLPSPLEFLEFLAWCPKNRLLMHLSVSLLLLLKPKQSGRRMKLLRMLPHISWNSEWGCLCWSSQKTWTGYYELESQGGAWIEEVGVLPWGPSESQRTAGVISPGSREYWDETSFLVCSWRIRWCNSDLKELWFCEFCYVWKSLFIPHVHHCCCLLLQSNRHLVQWKHACLLFDGSEIL